METKRKLSDAERFCLDAYVINGNRKQTYLLSHECNTSNAASIKAMIDRFFVRPDVKQYIAERKAGLSHAAEQAAPTRRKTLDKAAIIDELETAYWATKGTAEGRDILKQLTDLKQLKKEEEKSDEERVHIYLPETCSNCKYKAIVEAQQREAKEPES